MSVLNAHQRAVIRADTLIDPLIIDRVVDAYDALVDRGDIEAYKRYMATAIAQMNMPTIRYQDRPTAVDKVKTIVIKAYSDQWRCTFRQAALRLKKALEG